MSRLGRGTSAKKWARTLMKLGLFLTDAKLWSAVNNQLRERAEDIGESVRDTYEETTSRFSNAKSAIRGEDRWIGPLTSFLGGVGIGIGVGMLLAPVSGEEARAVIRDKAMDMKNRAMDMRERVGDYSAGASRYRGQASTGTEGD